jgi:hypothetical protein
VVLSLLHLLLVYGKYLKVSGEGFGNVAKRGLEDPKG